MNSVRSKEMKVYFDYQKYTEWPKKLHLWNFRETIPYDILGSVRTNWTTSWLIGTTLYNLGPLMTTGATGPTPKNDEKFRKGYLFGTPCL